MFIESRMLLWVAQATGSFIILTVEQDEITWNTSPSLVRECVVTHPTETHFVSIMCRYCAGGRAAEGYGTVPVMRVFAVNERAQINTLENVREQLSSWLRTSTQGVQKKSESWSIGGWVSQEEAMRGGHPRRGSTGGSGRGVEGHLGPPSPLPLTGDLLTLGPHVFCLYCQ